MYALVDGNNFYVSCERIFRPSLCGRPVVVLSNNDGCAIARSNEAKDLGIAMGAPWFQIRHLENTAGLVGLSANFTLYGDISDRMMSLSASLGPEQEVYSIDESFIGLHGVPEVTRRAWAIRARILRWIGIPCGIGIGSTKTLAKLANFVAKTAERKPGSYPQALAQVCNLAELPTADLEAIMATTAVGEVWGVGRRLAPQLQALGIHTALDLARLNPGAARARWSVVLERTVRELQGQSCMALEDVPAPKKEIACTRSFGRPVTHLPPLLEAISEFTTRAAQKLRQQGSLCGMVRVFAHTSPHRPGPRFAKGMVVPLPRPTSDTAQLVKATVSGMRSIYEPGFELIKAGVMLMDIAQEQGGRQGELDFEARPEPGPGHAGRIQLMRTMDGLNARYGQGMLHMASAGHDDHRREWGMKQERRTPQYTTRWSEVLGVRA
jgi:DNA polymerase V